MTCNFVLIQKKILLICVCENYPFLYGLWSKTPQNPQFLFVVELKYSLPLATFLKNGIGTVLA